ncbi:MAG: VOC family protein [Verrucomicrobia bacterium]|nr:VOC family protein [Verrucomicrobiota bacterium]
MRVSEILETCLYVGDLDAAEKFYSTVLGLEVTARLAGRHVFFRCGRRVFLIFNPAKTRELGTGLPPHGADGPGHAAFAVTEDELPTWRSHLERNGVAIEREINWPNGGRSIYFRDPAGNSLELASPRIWGIDESELPTR